MTKSKSIVKTPSSTAQPDTIIHWYQRISSWIGVVGIVVGIIVIIVQLILRLYHKTIYITIREKMCSVRGKYVTDDKDTIYMVEDSFWLMFYESAEVFGRLRPGTTYRARVFGKRIPFLGLFPTIRSVAPS